MNYNESPITNKGKVDNDTSYEQNENIVNNPIIKDKKDKNKKNENI